MAAVSVSRLSKRFGSTCALDDVSEVVEDGSFFGLLGPSGSGKSTLLRAIAGFVFPDSGSVHIGDVPVSHVPVERRDIGMVFQNYALFPNLSVAQNIEFGLRVRKVAAAERRRRVDESLALVELGDLGHRRPRELSGGQQQRVALARAIVTRPRVLLLDEPLSALDKQLRVAMQVELKRIQREVGITTIFVTHDQEEALTLSDRVGVLREGRLVQSGTPTALYHYPIDEFTACFLGEANIIEGSLDGSALRLNDGSTLRLPERSAVWQGHAGRVRVAVRPEHVALSARQPVASADHNQLQGQLTEALFAGVLMTCTVQCRGYSLKVCSLGEAQPKSLLGRSVWLSWPVERTMVFS